MDKFKRILELVDSETVQFSAELPKELHKSLVMGQTRYVCRYGTLSDGHEKITDAQRYYGAIKEMFALGQNIQRQKASAMLAQADLEEAEIRLNEAKTNPERLRGKAFILQAHERLVSALVTVEDQLRMLDEYNRIRLELKEVVEAKYPEGIEQAERDNWLATAEYRMLKGRVPGAAPELLSNIPLDPVTKAEFGLRWGRSDATAPLLVSEKEALSKLPVDEPVNMIKQLIDSNKVHLS